MQGRGTDRGPCRELGDGEGCVEALLGPGDDGCEELVGQVGDGAFDELPLAAVAVGGEDESSRHGVGDFGAVVAA